MALAIVNKVSESKNVGFNEQTEQKSNLLKTCLI